MSMLVFISLLIFWASSATPQFIKSKDVDALKLELIHVDSLISPYSPGNISFTKRLQRAVERSNERLQALQSKSSNTYPQSFEAPVKAGKGEFLMKLALGTPALPYSAIVDTGSDLTWTQCKPCSDCYKQPTPIYDPSNSSTYAEVPCKSPLCSGGALPEYTCNKTVCLYTYTYGDFSISSGVLSYEVFIFTSKSGAEHSLPHIAFGCGETNEGGGFNQGGGIVGLGRGPLSLITQLGSSVGNKFSYCLTSINDSVSKSSTIFFGEAPQLKKEVMRSTPFVQNKEEATYYYLSLKGISVGGKLLKIPNGTFDLRSDGTGGVIIDSGTTITYLHHSGYGALRKELGSLINLTVADGSAIGLDLCYKNPSADRSVHRFPVVTFHFDGADYDLPRENYMIADKSGLFCLGMMPSDQGVTIFGNVQQQNYHIQYDLGNNMLSFAPVLCDSL